MYQALIKYFVINNFAHCFKVSAKFGICDGKQKQFSKLFVHENSFSFITKVVDYDCEGNPFPPRRASNYY